VKTLSAASVRQSIWKLATAMPPILWLVAICVTVGTDLLDFLEAPVKGVRPGPGFVVAAIIRVMLVFALSYFVIRRMANVDRPYRLRPGFVRYVLFTLAMAALFGLLLRLVTLLGADRSSMAAEWMLMLVTMTGWSLLTIRLTAWSAGLAVDRPIRELPAYWRALAGNSIPLGVALLQIVTPFSAIHSALTLVAVRIPLAGKGLAALALIDGVVSTIQLMFTMALSVVAWRLADERLRDRGLRA